MRTDGQTGRHDITQSLFAILRTPLKKKMNLSALTLRCWSPTDTTETACSGTQSYVLLTTLIKEIWYLFDRALLIIQYRQPNRCNNNGLLINPISSTCFGTVSVPPHPSYRPATSWVYYTTSCKHSLLLLKMGEIIARNMLNWLEL